MALLIMQCAQQRSVEMHCRKKKKRTKSVKTHPEGRQKAYYWQRGGHRGEKEECVKRSRESDDGKKCCQVMLVDSVEQRKIGPFWSSHVQVFSRSPQMLNRMSGQVQHIGRTLNRTTGPVRHWSGLNQSLEPNFTTTNRVSH